MFKKNTEMNFLLNFIAETTMSREISRIKLQVLWIAYCIHTDLEIDSPEYVDILRCVWDVLVASAVSDSELSNPDWKSFYSFYDFMTIL